ncbi:MAG: helix-turn-helix transcriptional regulator [Clostridium sp.]
MINKRIRELRIEKELTQEDIAKMLNKSTNNISQYETGKRQPDINTIIKIAEYFNVSIDYLMGRTETRELADDFIKKNLKLTDDEKKILSQYRNLNKEGEKQAKEYLEYLAQKYIKNNNVSQMEKVN